MASNYRSMFVENLTISQTTEGLFDIDGNPLATADITNGHYAYSRVMTLKGDTSNYIFTAICDGCILTVTLLMSPDGINWCECILSGGNPCTVECTPIVGDCTTKIVDVNLLPYVKIRLGNAGSEGGTCSIGLYHELEQQADSGSITSGPVDDSIEQEVTYNSLSPSQNEKVV